jgi:hypothetical protein
MGKPAGDDCRYCVPTTAIILTRLFSVAQGTIFFAAPIFDFISRHLSHKFMSSLG